jgi:anti-sigma factor RsiW
MKPWLHPPDELLRRFLQGELEEGPAVAVALHLDDCPACQARRDGLDPLADALAALPPPEPPAELIAEVVERALAREPTRRVGALVPALGSGMAVAAALVFALGGGPGALFADLGALGSAALALLDVVELPVALLTPVWAAVAILAFAAAAMTARRLEGEAQP